MSQQQTLLVISGMPHSLRGNDVVGWGPTVRELSHLGSRYRLVHIAPLQHATAPLSYLPYTCPVHFVSVPMVGGPRIWDKICVLAAFFPSAFAIAREVQKADLIHVRGPHPMAMLAVVLLDLLRLRKPCWLKYAGTWKAYREEPWSFRVQRRIFERVRKHCFVSVNGESQGSHIHGFLNPCMTSLDIRNAHDMVAHKRMSKPLRLVFAGRVDQGKGIAIAVRVLKRLCDAGLDAELDVMGDGPLRLEVEDDVRNFNLTDRCRFHGWQPVCVVHDMFKRGHFLVLPSYGEGWPKVAGEAMTYGCVPIVADTGNTLDVLADAPYPLVVRERNEVAFAERIQSMIAVPGRWEELSSYAQKRAPDFSYEHFMERVTGLLEAV
jgi:glycosyltransferase involved in cell wall biosynthesis